MARKIVTKVIWDFSSEKPKYTPPVKVEVTSIGTRYVQLDELVSEGNVEEFSKLIKSTFSYRQRWGRRDAVRYNEQEKRWFLADIEYADERPLVEALFFEANRSFHGLIKSIKASPKSKEFYQALEESLKGTDLPKEKLFQWNATMAAEVLQQVELSLVHHAAKLKEENASKGEALEKVADSLKQEVFQLEGIKESEETRDIKNIKILEELEDLAEWAESYERETSEEHQRNLQVLDAKLTMLQKLHQHDDVFAVRRGYARAINIVTILFTAGIANLLHLAFKGSFLFFDKTATQERVASVDDKFVRGGMGIVSKERIQIAGVSLFAKKVMEVKPPVQAEAVMAETAVQIQLVKRVGREAAPVAAEEKTVQVSAVVADGDDQTLSLQVVECGEGETVATNVADEKAAQAERSPKAGGFFDSESRKVEHLKEDEWDKHESSVRVARRR